MSHVYVVNFAERSCVFFDICTHSSFVCVNDYENAWLFHIILTAANHFATATLFVFDMLCGNSCIFIVWFAVCKICAHAKRINFRFSTTPISIHRKICLKCRFKNLNTSFSDDNEIWFKFTIRYGIVAILFFSDLNWTVIIM